MHLIVHMIGRMEYERNLFWRFFIKAVKGITYIRCMWDLFFSIAIYTKSKNEFKRNCKEKK